MNILIPLIPLWLIEWAYPYSAIFRNLYWNKEIRKHIPEYELRKGGYYLYYKCFIEPEEKERAEQRAQRWQEERIERKKKREEEWEEEFYRKRGGRRDALGRPINNLSNETADQQKKALQRFNESMDAQQQSARARRQQVSNQRNQLAQQQQCKNQQFLSHYALLTRNKNNSEL